MDFYPAGGAGVCTGDANPMFESHLYATGMVVPGPGFLSLVAMEEGEGNRIAGNHPGHAVARSKGSLF